MLIILGNFLMFASCAQLWHEHCMVYLQLVNRVCVDIKVLRLLTASGWGGEVLSTNFDSVSRRRKVRHMVSFGIILNAHVLPTCRW